ncbi:MAG: hypothetical protein GWM98_13635 [Nitrospinaceae bacterium]|nr:hypothetical protein [Nitrospinaceae bacterium]NIR55321.1 hypothetical protein [Nitrospinaceae bacterium]NIS85760.1 hypothetical protein [Nitrospinaceae bacterium]NIT82610.1 hypothetical protein [Nitrospinaceae bacterium]NIU44815.1 hypothetical protein [Nitrospinaceae bacterium]
MRKLVLFTMVVVVALCFAASVSAKTLKPGDKAACNNANSITLEASGTSSMGDRGNANATVWKSSNATTVPISLGPTDHQNFKGGAAGAGFAGIRDHHSMGRKKVVLKKQNNFSRGDSIGDISGLVRIENTGTVNLNVTCG